MSWGDHPLSFAEASAVYDILIKHVDAPVSLRENFIIVMVSGDANSEYRFQGKLGFGGKYRPATNKVECYKEDENPERMALIWAVNIVLADNRERCGGEPPQS